MVVLQGQCLLGYHILLLRTQCHGHQVVVLEGQCLADRRMAVGRPCLHQRLRGWCPSGTWQHTASAHLPSRRHPACAREHDQLQLRARWKSCMVCSGSTWPKAQEATVPQQAPARILRHGFKLSIKGKQRQNKQPTHLSELILNAISH